MKILVTGGAGFIGSNLVDGLIDEGHEVFVIDNLSSGKKENLNKKAVFYKADICDLDKILPLFKEIDYVFHLAANPRVIFSAENPIESHKVNVNGTLNVLYASYKNKVKRLIFASSAAVYGNIKKLPLKEDITPNPVSPYGLHKLIGEYYCKLFSNLYNLETVCLRYFNVYGPRMDPNGPYALVIGKFLKLRKENKPLTIYGDGKQTRDFVYVDDVVKANILAMKSKKVGRGEIINICSGKNYSINYIAKLIGGKKIYLSVRKGEIKHTLGDNSLAKKLLGWKPEISLEEGIKKCKEYFYNLN
jgi:nucleoside-diphosphate-sugar epimerase